MESLLNRFFTIKDTNIELREKSTPISSEDFLEAVKEFLRASTHVKSRLGDMLNLYERRFGGEQLRNGLINDLVLNGIVSRKTCDNARSFAKSYTQRWKDVPDAWAGEIMSVRDERQRRLVLRQVENGQKRGEMNLVRVRELVRQAKRNANGRK